jgi:hypothetical protein
MNSSGQRLSPHNHCPLARILVAMAAGTRLGHSRRTDDVRQGRHFRTPNLHLGWRFDANPNGLPANSEDGDLDVVADLKLLVRLPRENQHGTHSFA